MLWAVPIVDVPDHLLAPRRREVDVHVRVARASFVDEPLEQQVVADGVDPRDPQHVRNDRVARAPPPLSRDAALSGELHQVPADQEELSEPRPLDHVELVGELREHARSERVVPSPHSLATERLEVAERRLALRDLERGEPVLLEPEVDPAGVSELRRSPHPLRPGPPDPGIRVRVIRRQREQSACRLQVELAVRAAQVCALVERQAVADRHHHVLQLAVLGERVVDVVRDGNREAELPGQPHRLGQEPVVVRQQVVLELKDESADATADMACPETARADSTVPDARAPAEQPRVALRDLRRALPIARQ